MPKRSDTFKKIVVAGVRSGLPAQRVADELKVAKSAVHTWMKQGAFISPEPGTDLAGLSAGIVGELRALAASLEAKAEAKRRELQQCNDLIADTEALLTALTRVVSGFKTLEGQEVAG